MKKVIVVMWIAIVALVATGCQAQQTNSEAYDEYEDLIEAIEDGDWELAQEELGKFFEMEDSDKNSSSAEDDMLKTENEDRGQVEETITEEAAKEEPPVEEEPETIVNLREAAVSEWIPSRDSKCEELGGIVIYEDGSCVIGEDVLQWEVSSATEKSGYIQVLSEGKRVYELNVCKEEEGYYAMWLYQYSDDETKKEYINGILYRALDLQKTEITIDNWEEYFVVETEIMVTKNEFDEPDDAHIYKYVKLNPDKISNVVEYLSNVAYEYKYLDGWATVNFDLETQEYTAEFRDGAYDDTCMSKMQFFGSEESKFYGGMIESRWITELPYDDSAFWEEYKEMLRMQGVIYSVK